MSVLIAIDQGTTSTRTVVYDQDLNILDSLGTINNDSISGTGSLLDN